MIIRRILEIILDLITAFLCFGMVTVAFHEYCHFNILRLFQGDGYVIFYWFAGYVAITKVPPTILGKFLTALAGGVGCFLLFLYFDQWWLEDPTDRWVRVACRFHLVSQLVYGIGEGLWFIGILNFEQFLGMILLSFLLGGIASVVQTTKALKME